MGLLDSLFSDDPKQQAILQMAYGLLSGSGRTNKNFAADLGNAGLLGVQGYGQQKTLNAKLAEEAQQAQLRDYALKTAQQNFADEQASRDVFAQRRAGMQPPQGMPQGGMPSPNSTGNLDSAGTPSLYGGQPAPFQSPPMQSPQGPQQMPLQGPVAIPYGKGATVTNAPVGGSGKFDTFNKYNSIADELENAGAIKQAQQYRDLAEKYRPKLKDEQVRNVNGTPTVVRNYEDGTTELSPYQPTANTEYLDVGNAKLPINKYTGGMGGQPIPMGMSPADAQRIGIERARLQYDTGMGGGGGGGAPGGGAPGVGGAAPGAPPGLPPAVQAKIAQSQAEGLNTGGVTYKNNLDTTVQTGNDLMMRIGESRKALDQFKPGMGAETRLQVARAAQAIGAPDGLVNAINAGDVSAKQEFMKLAAQQAMETLKGAMGGSGRITQAEFKVFQANNPNIELDPNAIKKIYDFAEKVHTRNVQEQSALGGYLQKGGNISQWPTVWTQAQVQNGYGPIQAPSSNRSAGAVRRYNPATGKIEAQ